MPATATVKLTAVQARAYETIKRLVAEFGYAPSYICAKDKLAGWGTYRFTTCMALKDKGLLKWDNTIEQVTLADDSRDDGVLDTLYPNSRLMFDKLVAHPDHAFPYKGDAVIEALGNPDWTFGLRCGRVARDLSKSKLARVDRKSGLVKLTKHGLAVAGL